MKVTNDLFDIVNRLKEIDPGYKVDLEDRFRIYLNDKICFSTDVLDERVLWKVREEIDLDEIFEHNEKVKESANRQMDAVLCELLDMLEFANQTSQDVTFGKTRRQI